MNCTNCDRPLVEGARFCGKCGTQVPESQWRTDEADDKPKKSKKVTVTEPDDIDAADPKGAPQLEGAEPTHHPEEPVIAEDDYHHQLTIEAPKPHHLLEGPHPALVKAQHANKSTNETDTAVEKESDDVDADVDKDEPHLQPKHAGRDDMPGPDYPFGTQMSNRNYLTAFLLSFFLGTFGADRFYTGHVLYGFVKLFTVGGFGILSFIDTILLLVNARRDRYGRRLWGRNKDFRTSLYIFIAFMVVLVGLTVFAIMNLPPGAIDSFVSENQPSMTTAP